jgi:Zn-dependent protease with chaperone function
VAQPAALEDARADLLSDQRTAAHHAHRRARLIAAAPGFVVFVVVGVIVTLAASPLAGVIAGVVAGALWWTFTLREARRVVLRSMRVEDVDADGMARLENLVDGLCATMGLTPPEVRTIEDSSVNAIVVGRRPDDAVLVVTTGLLTTLDPVALEGVLAHELTHVKNGDIAPATVAVAVLLPLAVFSASVGDTVHRWAGRGREFRADADAVRVTRYPPGLRDALSTMASGGPARPSSPLAAGAMARATRWLWAVALPGPAGSGAGAGELDAPAARIAALDEW